MLLSYFCNLHNRNGKYIFICIFSNALKQYTTVTTKYILDQIISATLQPVISVEIQNAKKYILFGYDNKLKLYFKIYMYYLKMKLWEERDI